MHFIVTKLDNQQLLEKAISLPSTGTLLQAYNGYVYLSVASSFIEVLYPLIQQPEVLKPEKEIGAHISFIYPSEYSNTYEIVEIGRTYHFKVLDYFQIHLNDKIYFCLSVAVPELNDFRKKYGLDPVLYYKGYNIFPHITIGVVNI